MKRIITALSILIIYAIGGYLHRGWFDIPGVLTLSLLIAPIAMMYPERSERK